MQDLDKILLLFRRIFEYLFLFSQFKLQFSPKITSSGEKNIFGIKLQMVACETFFLDKAQLFLMSSRQLNFPWSEPMRLDSSNFLYFDELTVF